MMPKYASASYSITHILRENVFALFLMHLYIYIYRNTTYHIFHLPYFYVSNSTVFLPNTRARSFSIDLVLAIPTGPGNIWPVLYHAISRPDADLN